MSLENARKRDQERRRVQVPENNDVEVWGLRSNEARQREAEQTQISLL